MSTNKIVLGADPELIFERGGQKVNADTLIPNHARMEGFGCDGHPATCELRPGYSDSIFKMVAKIEHVLKEGDEIFKLNTHVDKILSGHYKHDEPIGGHIHISYPGLGMQLSRGEWTNEVLRREQNPMLYDTGHALDFFMIDCLEELLGNKAEMRRRTNTAYGGKFNGYLVQRGGIHVKDNNRIEYRAPGSWLVHPHVAFTYLFVAKASAVAGIHGDIKVGELGTVFRDSDRIKALNRLAEVALKRDKSLDMKTGAEIMADIITKKPDWSVDIRKNWF